MRKIVMAAIGGERAVLWGDGQQRREVVFVGDFVQAALRLVAMVDDDVVNVGTGEEYSIRWYVKRICALIGYDPALVGYDKGRYVGVHSKVLDVAKLRRLLPDMQWTSFDAGMRSTLNWYRQIIDP